LFPEATLAPKGFTGYSLLLSGTVVPMALILTLYFFRMFRSIYFPITAALSLASACLLIGEEKSVPMKIEALVAQTLRDNPEIKFYEAEILASKAGRKIAGKLDNPELDLQFGSKRTTGGEFSSEGFAYAASLVQPIEWPGRIGLRKSIANGDVQLAELGLAQFKTYLAGRVQALAYRLSIEQTKASIAAEVSDRFTAVKEVLVQRESGGIAPLLEVRAIDAASVSMEKAALDAAVEMQRVLLELNQLMGKRADSALVVARVDFSFPEYGTLGELLAKALTNNYRMHIRKAELAQQGLRVSLAENERYPAIKVGPYVSQANSGERETQAGIGLSFELPIYKRGDANIDLAEAKKIQVRAMMHQTSRELEREVAEAVLVYTNDRARLQTWTEERIKSFREGAELADRHYRLGAVPVATYIELQKSYLEALEAISEVKAEALEAALELEQLIGTTQSLVKAVDPPNAK
jgi:cobalt-zinc-cadmium efflux system outer membrane protein